MESVFHFICGTTGSEVCFNFFACVALIDSLLCTCTLGVVPIESLGEKLGAVSGASYLSVHIFLEVAGYVVKACGCLIFRNLTNPIAFACVLPTMIGPAMLVYFKNGWECFVIDMQVQNT